MISYEDYIKRLKDGGEEPDYGRMHAHIKVKISGRKRFTAARVALAGALTLMLLGFTFYYNYTAPGDNVLLSYVINGDEVDDGPVMEYIFME